MCSDRQILCFLLLVALSGCSVKEDRTECPCFLTLDWSGVDCWAMMEAGNDALSWNVSDVGGTWREAGELPLETLDPTYDLSVPKDSIGVSVACGASPGPEGEVIVPEGTGFPRLYFYSGIVDATGMTAVDTVYLHREHAELFLYVRNVMQTGAVYEVEGTIAGCDMYGTPVPGRFVSRVVTDNRGLGSLVIPRQLDGSLRLNVIYAGEVVRSLAIGEYIIQSGYDWSATDLKDISMEIDFYQTEVTVRIEQWKKTLTFTIVF